MTQSPKDPTATHIYHGDLSSYEVRIVSGTGLNNTVNVRVLALNAGEGSVPVGSMIRVSRRRLDKIGGESR